MWAALRFGNDGVDDDDGGNGSSSDGGWSDVRDDMQDWELISEDDGGGGDETGKGIRGCGSGGGNVPLACREYVSVKRKADENGEAMNATTSNVAASAAATPTAAPAAALAAAELPRAAAPTQAEEAPAGVGSSDASNAIKEQPAVEGLAPTGIVTCPKNGKRRGNIFSSCAQKSTNAFVAAMDDLFSVIETADAMNSSRAAAINKHDSSDTEGDAASPSEQRVEVKDTADRSGSSGDKAVIASLAPYRVSLC